MRFQAVEARRFVLVAVLFAIATPAVGHNVWCHCPKKEARQTLEFFHLAGEVYEAHAQAVKLWHASNTPLETGVLAEFEHHVRPKRALRPAQFRETLTALQKLNTQLGVLDRKLGAVIKSLDGNEDDVTPGFDETVAKLLRESKDLRRVSDVGLRYGDVGGMTATKPTPASVLEIYQAQREDLAILRKLLPEVIAGLRDAIPLAEKGEFAAVMLSGRNAFGDKMPQFTDLFSAYDRFYVQSCMATIAATMQVYPAGFEWLRKSR